MARSGMVAGSQTYEPSVFRAYFWPGPGLVTGTPFGSVGTQAGSAAVAKGFTGASLPVSPTVFTPGTNPMSSGVDGPRFEAPDASALSPVPAFDGRGWKYWLSSVRLLLVKIWP